MVRIMSTAPTPSLGHQELHLVQADAVFAGAGAFEREARASRVAWLSFSAVPAPPVGPDRAGSRSGSCRRPHGRPGSRECRWHRLPFTDSSRQSARREIGTQVSVEITRQPGRDWDRREVGVVPRGPQAGAFFRRAGPLEGCCRRVAGDLLHRLGLLLHTGGRAVEFHQQHRLLAQLELAEDVDHAHRVGSISSTRAIGTPSWMIWIVVRTAASMLGNEQIAAEIASGKG